MITFDSRRFKNGVDMGTNPWGPQELNVPQAIVKLLTFGLQPGIIIDHAETKIITRGGIMDDVDVSNFEGPAEEIAVLMKAARHFLSFEDRPFLSEDVEPHPYWQMGKFQNISRTDKAAKLALFLATREDVYTDEAIFNFSRYDIDDLADAIYIVDNDPNYTIVILIDAMFEIAPHKRLR